MNWSATNYFERLTSSNRFALEHDFCFARISGADGLEEMLASMQSRAAFVAVSDISTGYTEIFNSPHTKRIKTIYMAMRHKIDDMNARNRCFDTMRELFRQFMSHLIRERTRLEERNIYIDERITFTEVPQYAFSGCAVASFSVAVTTYTNLRFDDSEWLDTNT